jgi:hypothetical protein
LLRNLRHKFLIKISSSVYTHLATHLAKPIAEGKQLALGKPIDPRHPIFGGKLRRVPLLGH